MGRRGLRRRRRQRVPPPPAPPILLTPGYNIAPGTPADAQGSGTENHQRQQPASAEPEETTGNTALLTLTATLPLTSSPHSKTKRLSHTAEHTAQSGSQTRKALIWSTWYRGKCAPSAVRACWRHREPPAAPPGLPYTCVHGYSLAEIWNSSAPQATRSRSLEGRGRSAPAPPTITNK